MARLFGTDGVLGVASLVDAPIGERSLSLGERGTEGESMAKGNHSFSERDIHSRFGAIVGRTVAEVDTAGVLAAS